jgi:hypothetical protein
MSSAYVSRIELHIEAEQINKGRRSPWRRRNSLTSVAAESKSSALEAVSMAIHVIWEVAREAGNGWLLAICNHQLIPFTGCRKLVSC